MKKNIDLDLKANLSNFDESNNYQRKYKIQQFSQMTSDLNKSKNKKAEKSSKNIDEYTNDIYYIENVLSKISSERPCATDRSLIDKDR